MARAVNRVPQVEKFNKDLLSAVAATLWSLHARDEPEVIFKDKTGVEKTNFEDKVILSRNVYLRAADFDDFGTT